MAAAIARTKSGEQPCVERQPSLWYGDKIGNWRDCLEALTAGDFLTPVSIGLVFRDVVRFGWWEDRATALERSWEERFSLLAGTDIDKWPDQCPGDLRCPFMTVRPQDSHWIPLLVLNGVSSATGRRILTTVLATNYQPEKHVPGCGRDEERRRYKGQRGANCEIRCQRPYQDLRHLSGKRPLP